MCQLLSAGVVDVTVRQEICLCFSGIDFCIPYQLLSFADILVANHRPSSDSLIVPSLSVLVIEGADWDKR